MSASSELLKRYLENKGLAQKDLAKEWKVSTTYISQVKNGRDHLSDQRIIEVSESLGLNPAHYLIQIQAEKAKTEKERATWLKLLKSNAAVALLAIPLAKHLSGFALCTDMFKEFPSEAV